MTMKHILIDANLRIGVSAGYLWNSKNTQMVQKYAQFEEYSRELY